MLCARLCVFAARGPDRAGAHRRQKLVTFIGKMIFVLAGVKVTMRGIDNLPTDSCVVVANHASYIDGILLNGLSAGTIRFRD